jgi:hypothetical protein
VYLLDTSVVLEFLLDQEKADDVQALQAVVASISMTPISAWRRESTT